MRISDWSSYVCSSDLALEAAGVGGISIDLTLPDLVETLAAGSMPIAANRVAALQASLDGKDAAGLTALGADAHQPLIAAAGPVDPALQRPPAFGAGAALDTRLEARKSAASWKGGSLSVDRGGCGSL